MSRALSADGSLSDEIVIFRPELVEFGGEERVILALSRKLHELRKRHCVLCYFDSINLAAYSDVPLKVHQLTPRRNPLSKALSLRRYLHSLGAAGAAVPVLFSIQSAYHAGLFVGTPYHLWIPDTFSLLSGGDENGRALFWPKIGIRKLLLPVFTGRGIRRAQAFVTNTKALRDEMKTLYARGGDVIYLGGFGGPLPRAPERRPVPIKMLSVSRLQASKRIDWVLRALAHQPKLPAWELHIVGKGPEREALMSLTNTLGLADRVLFHGFVDDENLAALYRQSHMFVMPARQGYGLPAIEALYQYLAVVLSADSGVAELLENTPWVALSSGGPDDFGTALRAMLQRVADPAFFQQGLPDLPTEDRWAEEFVRRCNW